MDGSSEVTGHLRGQSLRRRVDESEGRLIVRVIVLHNHDNIETRCARCNL